MKARPSTVVLQRNLAEEIKVFLIVVVVLVLFLFEVHLGTSFMTICVVCTHSTSMPI